MGTSIELKISDVSLDYAKNWMGNDYGYLFQEADLTCRRADGINYEYYAEHPDEDAEREESEQAFVRPLSRVIPRLRLLGHTLEGARAEYQALLDDAASLSDDGDPAGESSTMLTFEEFCSLANLCPLASLATEYIDYDTEERAAVAQGRFAAHSAEFLRLPWTDNSDMYWSESSYLSAKICILSAPSMLQIFALNPENTNAEVMWQFGPIVNAGWVSLDAFRTGARRTQSILGSVWIQDSHPGLIVIQAWNGPIRFD
jgi:hypothetical protein